MIFNATRVKALINQYQQEGDEYALEQVLQESIPLIQAMVATTGFEFSNNGADIIMSGGITGDDVIQACLIKIYRAATHYDAEKSNPYNYFTTIIRNCCNDALAIIMRDGNLMVLVDDTLRERDDEVPLDENLLTGLITWTRQRFPSISIDIVDHVTEYVLITLTNSPFSMMKTKSIIMAYLMARHPLKRDVINVLYQSIIIKLRMENYDKAARFTIVNEEYTLLPDVRDAIGIEAYEKMTRIFSGMNIKIP